LNIQSAKVNTEGWEMSRTQNMTPHKSSFRMLWSINMYRCTDISCVCHYKIKIERGGPE
jgi:hypothetical protein